VVGEEQDLVSFPQPGEHLEGCSRPFIVECEITDLAGHPVIVMRQGEPEDRSDRVSARNQTKEEGY
jgi:hypothetical protein